ncbi:MAG: SPASM domain-containing protein [Candidatus Saccharicenans sp.]
MIKRNGNSIRESKKTNHQLDKLSPFVFRIEVKENTGLADEIVSRELSEVFSLQIEFNCFKLPSFAEWLQKLDDQPGDFNLVIYVRNLGEDPLSALWGLRHLKKLDELGIIIEASEPEEKVEVRLDELKLAENSSFRTRAVVEIDCRTEISSLKKLLDRVFLETSASVYLRKKIGHSLNRASEFSSLIANYKDRLLPLVFEDCFPEINPELWLPEISCRGAQGSCFISADGHIYPCRKSRFPEGNILKDRLKEIFESWGSEEIELCLENVAEKRKQLLLPVAGEKPFLIESDLKPIPLFRVREEKQGATLIKGLDGLAVTSKGYEIIRELDRKKTLKSLKKKYGGEAISFIFSLFMSGFLKFEK